MFQCDPLPESLPSDRISAGSLGQPILNLVTFYGLAQTRFATNRNSAKANRIPLKLVQFGSVITFFCRFSDSTFQYTVLQAKITPATNLPWVIINCNYGQKRHPSCKGCTRYLFVSNKQYFAVS